MGDVIILDEHFTGHEILEHFSNDIVEIVEFGKPNNFNGWMRYIINGKFLTVQGDYGDAVYFWSGKGTLTFEWLSGLSLDYFAGKCQASEYGSGFKSWDSDKARDYLEECIIWDKVEENWDHEIETERYKDGNISKVRLKERSEDYTIEEYNKVKEQFESMVEVGRVLAEETEVFDNCENEYGWNKWLEDYGDEVFGSDWWEFAGNVGKNIHLRCELHLHGIKLIAKLLKEKADGEG